MDNSSAGNTAAANEVVTAEAIHQEIRISAPPARVYEALTNAAHFSELIKLGAVPQSGPATISDKPGGEFAIFGGFITGRQIELVPNERVVQTWRVGNWPQGHHSIAHFTLRPEGDGTLVVFDHTGFPAGQGAHLVAGWYGNYWEPLRKYLK